MNLIPTPEIVKQILALAITLMPTLKPRHGEEFLWAWRPLEAAHDKATNIAPPGEQLDWEEPSESYWDGKDERYTAIRHAAALFAKTIVAKQKENPAAIYFYHREFCTIEIMQRWQTEKSPTTEEIAEHFALAQNIQLTEKEFDIIVNGNEKRAMRDNKKGNHFFLAAA